MASRITPLRRLTAHAVRFAIAGAVVGLAYVGLTLLMSGPLDVAIQVAIPIAYVLAVCLHFVLQRHFVFHGTKEFALSTGDQIGRYVLIGVVQYAITALATALLPDAIGVTEQVAYVATVVTISVTFFVLLRTRVFHPAEGART